MSSLHDPQQDLFDCAEAGLRERVRDDGKRADTAPTQRILESVAEAEGLLHLDVRQLRTACEILPEGAEAFRDELGLEPEEYVLRAKMEAGRELLAHRHLKTWQIARALGYSGAPSFSRAFKKVYGKPPTAAAKELRTLGESLPATEPPATSGPLGGGMASNAFWYAAVVDALDKGDQRALESRLRRLTTMEPARTVRLRSRDTDHDQKVVLEVWSLLRPLSHQERLRRLRQTIRVDSTAFFHVLGREYRQAMSETPHEAFDLATLSLAHAEANPEAFGEEQPQFEALAQARRAYALHRSTTERSEEVLAGFEHAWSRWRASRRHDVRIEVEICHFHSEVLHDTERYDEALPLMNRTITLARIKGLDRLLARALVQRLSAVNMTRPLEEVVAEADLVKCELQRLKDSDWLVLVYAHLARAYRVAGEIRQAETFRFLVELSIRRWASYPLRRRRPTIVLEARRALGRDETKRDQPEQDG